MGSTNKFFKKKDNGLGLDLWWETRPYDGSAGPTATSQFTGDSRQIGSYSKRTDSNGKDIYTTIFTKSPGSEFVDSKLSKSDDESVNQTSLIDIVGWLQKQGPSTSVGYADFAYLKNLGVYPTNRLMIARRFQSPTQNNLLMIRDSPMATMISWMPDDSDFFEIRFGEEWEQLRETSFTSILNSVGEDLGKKTNLGSAAAGGFKTFTLPGWTEALQIQLFNRLFGNAGNQYDNKNPPYGNPNLIKEAMVRQVVSKELPGSGLNSSFSIKFVVEYEQKFLNGVDPSLVYLDILHKALIFGTSKSTFFFGNALESGSSDFIKNLVSGDFESVKKALTQFVESLYQEFKKIAAEIKAENDRNAKNNSSNKSSIDDLAYNFIKKEGKAIVATLVSKYRVKLFGVLQALTGAPSGYWHVTLGNPKKPFFSSGDLYTTGVTMTFGKVLSFNDLPSSIKLEFTLVPARTLGGQEIMDRFNTGESRTYNQNKVSYVTVPNNPNK